MIPLRRVFVSSFISSSVCNVIILCIKYISISKYGQEGHFQFLLHRFKTFEIVEISTILNLVLNIEKIAKLTLMIRTVLRLSAFEVNYANVIGPFEFDSLQHILELIFNMIDWIFRLTIFSRNDK